MKFYYEDKLIRTSKTHVYTHALIGQSGKAITCSATREGCEKELLRRLHNIERSLMNHENALKAQAAGKKQVRWWFDGRTSYYVKLCDIDNLDKFEEYIIADKEIIRIIMHEWKIIELEAR